MDKNSLNEILAAELCREPSHRLELYAWKSELCLN